MASRISASSAHADAALDRRSVSPNHSNVRLDERAKAGEDPCCNVPCFKEDLVTRLRSELPDKDELENLRVVFTALSDGTRLKLLHALRGGDELCVCDAAHVLGMSVAATSHHLRKLRDLRILKFRNDGKMAYYSLRNPVIRTLINRALRS